MRRNYESLHERHEKVLSIGYSYFRGLCKFYDPILDEGRVRKNCVFRKSRRVLYEPDILIRGDFKDSVIEVKGSKFFDFKYYTLISQIQECEKYYRKIGADFDFYLLKPRTSKRVKNFADLELIFLYNRGSKNSFFSGIVEDVPLKSYEVAFN